MAITVYGKIKKKQYMDATDSLMAVSRNYLKFQN